MYTRYDICIPSKYKILFIKKCSILIPYNHQPPTIPSSHGFRTFHPRDEEPATELPAPITTIPEPEAPAPEPEPEKSPLIYATIAALLAVVLFAWKQW